MCSFAEGCFRYTLLRYPLNYNTYICLGIKVSGFPKFPADIISIQNKFSFYIFITNSYIKYWPFSFSLREKFNEIISAEVVLTAICKNCDEIKTNRSVGPLGLLFLLDSKIQLLISHPLLVSFVG